MPASNHRPMRSCARLRPLTPDEKPDGSAWVVTGGARLGLRRDVLERDGRANWLADSEFAVDVVFGPETSTDEVYAKAAADVVPPVLRGMNSTLVAYGQTASGKTYTMIGSSCAAHLTSTQNERGRGLISLAVEDLVRHTREQRGRRNHRLRVSFLEVYNEMCNDLLAPSRANLKLFERADGVLVSGLSEWEVSDATDLDALLRAAERQRHVGSTASNDRSSRSHLLCTVTVDSWAEDEGEDGGEGLTRPSGSASEDDAAASDPQVLSGTLQLVDLAGSERRQAATNEHQGHEGASINKSLLTLSTIIHRLSEMPHAEAPPLAPASHLPFRDSKLTRLLQPCLGGPAHAVIVATLRQGANFVDESLATLRFAVRARRVLNSTGADAHGAQVSAALLSKMSAEIVALRKQLSAEQHKRARPAPLKPTASDRAHKQQQHHHHHHHQRLLQLQHEHQRNRISHAGDGGARPFSASSPPRLTHASPPRQASSPSRSPRPAVSAAATASELEPGARLPVPSPQATRADLGDLHDALERLGVDASSVARDGASLDGLRALEHAGRVRQSLAYHAAQVRSLTRGRVAADRRLWSGAGARAADGGAKTADTEAAADASLVEALEGQLVDILGATSECVTGLLTELEHAHARERSSAAAAAATLKRGRTGGNAASSPPPPTAVLRDEHARAVRRSRATACGQHDLLLHLVACRLDAMQSQKENVHDRSQ